MKTELSTENNINNTSKSATEFPTIPLLRERINEYCKKNKGGRAALCRKAGINPWTLADICSRPPGTNKTQKPEQLIILVDKLNQAGVRISRQDICDAILSFAIVS